MVAIDDIVEDYLLTASVDELVRARYLINGKLEDLLKKDTVATPVQEERPLHATAPMEPEEEEEDEEEEEE